MRAPKQRPTAEKLRPWRAYLLRSRNRFLGIVYAPDEMSAEAAAMAEFKTGKRPSTVMDRIAKGFSDDETKAIAAWFAAQKE